MYKKIISILLSLAMTFSLCVVCLASGYASVSFGKYDHVYIIGIDGAGKFIENADTPNFDRIFADGAVKYNAKSEAISMSAENWGSVLCGVSYDEHGLNNDMAAKYNRYSTSDNCTIFKYVRDDNQRADLASFSNWIGINTGIVEDDINVNKVQIGDDSNLTGEVLGYLNAGYSPKLMFVQLDEVDHAAHSYGGQSEEYYEAIENADTCIGRIYDSLEAKGLLSSGLFIVVADHGEALSGGHGGSSADECEVTIAVKGKTVVSGYGFEDDTRNRDVAAIALYALGIEKPSHMTAVVPEGLFEGGNEEIIPEEGLFQVFIRKLKEFFNTIIQFFENLF